MRWWLALLTILASGFAAAMAGPVIITSGEHPGFTRLVMQYDGPVDWQVGRTPDGYDLRISHQKPAYDLTKAFDLIKKSRLADLWVDPQSGDLNFGIACACYAMPFEFRPGIIVVDLYDGIPPKGSSFEVPLDGPKPVAALPLPPKTDTAVPVYRWTDLAFPSPLLQAVRPKSTTAIPPDAGLSTIDLGLEPLRLTLMQELSRGASQGIVDMAKPGEPVAEMADGDPSIQIHLGETPDLVIRQKGQDGLPLTAQGEECLSDDQLDVSVWGSGRPIADQMGPERQGMTGEFDRPDPDAVTRAIRFQLFLGFGAEARSLIRAFPDDLPDKPVWISMARILDGEPDPESAFVGMADCETAAALWATLADPQVRPFSDGAKAAVMRSFSALPPHLRRLLGPRLVERFLAASEIPIATALRDAVLRAPGDPGPEIALMQAKMDQTLGKPGKAQAQLEDLATAPGPASAEALVALVEQRAALGQSVEFAQVQALEELLKERSGGADAPRFKRAVILARAASGDFDGAFSEIDAAPEAKSTLWKLLAQAGADTALLNLATLGPTDLPPLAASQSASLIADRLLGLGLSDQAAKWLTLDQAAPRPLQARVALAQGKPQAALDVLQGDDSSVAMTIQAQAYAALGDAKKAAELYARLGKPEDEWSALSLTGDWGSVAAPAPWKAVSDVVTAAPSPGLPTDGPLARNKALVEGSAATRDAITALLDSVKSPAQPTQ